MLKRTTLIVIALILLLLLPPQLSMLLISVMLIASLRCTYYWSELKSLFRPIILIAKEVAPYVVIALGLSLATNLTLGLGLPGLAAGVAASYVIHRKRRVRLALVELYANVTNEELVKLALDSEGVVCVHKGRALVYSRKPLDLSNYGRQIEGRLGVGRRVGKVMYARGVDLRRLSESYVVCFWVGGPDRPPECCKGSYGYCREYQYATLRVATYTAGRRSPMYVSHTIVVPIVGMFGVEPRDKY